MEVTTPFRTHEQQLEAVGFIGFYLMREFDKWPARFKDEQPAVIARASRQFLNRIRLPEPGDVSDETQVVDFVQEFVKDLDEMDFVRAEFLDEDDQVDLEDDPYVRGSDMERYMEYEYGVVTGIEFETPGCVAVSFEGIDTFGFPPTHELWRKYRPARKRNLTRAEHCARGLDRFASAFDERESHGAVASDFESPGLRLNRSVTRSDTEFQIVAFRVTTRDSRQVLDWEFNEDASDRLIDAEYQDLCNASHVQAPFQTVRFFDKDYVVFWVPEHQ